MALRAAASSASVRTDDPSSRSSMSAILVSTANPRAFVILYLVSGLTSPGRPVSSSTSSLTN